MHADPLVGNDSEISDYTTAATEFINNRGIMFTVQFMSMAENATVAYIMPPLSNNCNATENSVFYVVHTEML